MDDDAAVPELFREAMAGLCSGVAVITARRDDGDPCGLVATSVSSFSAQPPSVLVSVDHSSRCHRALVDGDTFGVHVLAKEQEALAHVFAGRGEDKFAGVEWAWDDGVARIDGSLSYLRCRRSALFELYDHSLLVGDVTGGRVNPGEPLVWMRRSFGWQLTPRD
ncbi:MAG TPA: flavin reductase family protein [Thermoleophilaceae bacterium]